MNYIIYTAFSFIQIINPAPIDLGAPTIQAICRVTLVNGESIEGIISFGPGGYEYNYSPHGFCFVHKNGVYQLFTYGFNWKKLTPSNMKHYRDGTSRLYYVENITREIFPKSKDTFVDSTRVLTRITTETQSYRLSDKMILFNKLPLNLYVGYSQDNKDERFDIEVIDIRAVEILENAPQKWIDLIENARTAMQGVSDNWSDYIEPAWYHEIVKDEKTVLYLKQFF